MSQNYTPDYNTTANTQTGGTEAYSDTGTASRQGGTSVKDKMAEQAAGMKEKVSQRASDIGGKLTDRIDNARGKTSAGLRTTSQRIQNLAMYVEEHDARDMGQQLMSTTREGIRKHPGRSLLIGLGVGMLLGRMFSGGGGHYHHHHR